MTRRALAGNTASALVGALVGALVVLAVDGLTRTTSPGSSGDRSPRPQHELPAPTERRPAAASKILLAWAPGGLPAQTERVLERMPQVRHATTIVAGVDWMVGSRARDGTPIDAPRSGYAIPLEVALVEPREYARFVPAAERDVVLSLQERTTLLADTEAELRGYGAGLRLELRDRTLRASAVVSDVATNGYEALIAGAVPESWTRADRFVLVRLEAARHRRAVRRRIVELLEPGQMLRTRNREHTPFLRYGDAVQSQMIIKSNFGEFAARPLPDGTVAIDPRWVDRNIRRANVPLLGEVTCHRALFAQLRAALREVIAEGISYVVDRNTGQFGGCFSARFINSEPGGRLSHHSWGIALDINVGDNAFGTKPDQDPRLVDIMERWGFTWGGRWIVPDGMHFEWNRWP